MIVTVASLEDIPGWNALAREVETLFGAAMAGTESFQEVLQRKIDQGLAFCVRENDGPPGAALCGGLLFSTRRHPVYEIGWLATAEKWQRCGVARALFECACGLVVPPAEVIVTTFAPGTPGGEPAALFYQRLGFIAAELAARCGAERRSTPAVSEDHGRVSLR